MPKAKTKKSAAKRISKTGSGLLKRMKANKSHILTKKSRKRKRNLRQSTTMEKPTAGLKRILPYA